jgi:hypothetical protein
MIAALVSETNDFETRSRAHAKKRAEFHAETQAKNASRKPVKDRIRQIVNIAKANGADGPSMFALGVPKISNDMPSQATVPLVQVDTSMRLNHIVQWMDQSLSGKRRPRGVLGVEIWVKVGGNAPGSESDCRFVAFATTSPYQVTFAPADVGQAAHYLLRWQFRDGRLSGWCETYSATITG